MEEPIPSRYGTASHSVQALDSLEAPSEKYERDKEASLSPWLRSFYRFHFGLDVQVAAWLWLASSVFWVCMSLDAISKQSSRADELLGNYAQLLSATMFSIGSVISLEASYPEARAVAKHETLRGQASSLNWMERYVTGNDALLVSWAFTLCIVPFVTVGIYLLAMNAADPLGYAYVISGTFGMMGMLVLVVASMPESLEANDGAGSSHIFSFLVSSQLLSCFSGEATSFFVKYFRFDLIWVLWGFLLAAVSSMIFALILVSIHPASSYSWWSFSTSVAFITGACAMLHSGYHPGSSMIYDSVSSIGLSSCCLAMVDKSGMNEPLLAQAKLDAKREADLNEAAAVAAATAKVEEGAFEENVLSSLGLGGRAVSAAEDEGGE